jgi:hypothetical protein
MDLATTVWRASIRSQPVDRAKAIRPGYVRAMAVQRPQAALTCASDGIASIGKLRCETKSI